MFFLSFTAALCRRWTPRRPPAATSPRPCSWPWTRESPTSAETRRRRKNVEKGASPPPSAQKWRPLERIRRFLVFAARQQRQKQPPPVLKWTRTSKSEFSPFQDDLWPHRRSCKIQGDPLIYTWEPVKASPARPHRPSREPSTRSTVERFSK